MLPLSSGPAPVLIAPDRFLSRSHLVQVTRTPPQLVSGCEWDKVASAHYLFCLRLERLQWHSSTKHTVKHISIILVLCC
jgi:hypothetical protein